MKILPLAWPRSLRSRGLRLWSGSVLGLFILGHFINVALGLISVRAMEIVRPVLGGIWNSRLGSTLLVGALLIHFGLALRALFIRRTLRMSAREAWQLGFGLALPFLVVAHVMAARIEPALTGEEMTFALQVRALWIDNPVGGGRQAAALLVAWAHGCFGFWFALRAVTGSSAGPGFSFRLPCWCPFWRFWASLKPAERSPRKLRRPSAPYRPGSCRRTFGPGSISVSPYPSPVCCWHAPFATGGGAIAAFA